MQAGSHSDELAVMYETGQARRSVCEYTPERVILGWPNEVPVDSLAFEGPSSDGEKLSRRRSNELTSDMCGG